MSKVSYDQVYSKVLTLADKQIKVEIGKFSQQASAAVLLTCGETMVHSTVALGRKVNLDYFPLSVEYIEKLYAGGIIKGSRWVKRDGRPSDEAILKARVIDRTMRPLFAEGIRNEVQIINTVFSYDGENEPDMLALLGSAIGLSISQIPFSGPVAGMRIGYNKAEGKFMINPTNTQMEESDLDLIVSGSGHSIVMVEAGANEISEAVMVDALELAQNEFKKICQDIEEIVAEVGKPKAELLEEQALEEQTLLEKLTAEIKAKYAEEIVEIVKHKAHLEESGFADLVEKIVDEYNEGKEGIEELVEDTVTTAQVEEILYKLMKQAARAMILEEGVRPDGRKSDEIRPIWCEIDVFPRTHGSAMFKRGATQAVTVVTLGSPSLGQYIEDMAGEGVRHYMHFYNMPPYASGEAGRVGYPKRREVGHGALAERALKPMIPSQEEFPYTIHVVSEILSSNGSTSQASVCGSTLSLMAAGVPIKRPVAGIAMGLMSDGDKYQILSDIQGLEDHVGDMDFKVAGTSEGITAIQMDIKLTGLPREILEKALAQAKVGRDHIMGEMLKCIDTPRTSLSVHAPKIEQITIPYEKVGEVIGTGGKVIKDINAQSGAQVDVEADDEAKTAQVFISSPDQEAINKARSMVEALIKEIELDEEYEGTVTRIEDYGAFVEILPGREGLCHISAMAVDYVDDPRTIVKLGDKVKVRVSEIKEDGKIGLSMLSKEEAAKARANGGSRGARPRPAFRGRRNDNDGNRRFDNNRRGNSNRSRNNSGFRSQLTK